MRRRAVTRRLRTERMTKRTARAISAAGLRADIAEIARKVREGDLTINGARTAMGFPAMKDPYGETIVRRRPGDLPGGLAWHGFAAPDSLSDEAVAEWQRAWDETMAAAPSHRKIMHLPQEVTLQPSRPRKSTPRGLPRMREHTRTLLLNALGDDGTFENHIQIRTCKALRVLPWHIGLRAQDSSIEVPKRTTCKDVDDAFFEHIVRPAMLALPRALGADALEFVLSEDPRGTQIDLGCPATPWIDPNGDPS